MAATVDGSMTALAVPFGLYQWDLSSLTSDALETLTYSDFTTLTPVFVMFVVTTQADDHSSVAMDWVSTTAASSLITVRFKAEFGGNLTGAKVRVLAMFTDMKKGGIS